MSIIEEVIVFFISILGTILGFLVWNVNRKKNLNRWFLALTISITLWVVFSALGFYESNPRIASLYYKINWAAVSFFLLSSYIFYVENFLKSENKIIRILIVIFSSFFILFSLFSNLIIKSVSVQEWGNEISFGSLNDYFNIFALLISLLIVYKFIKDYLVLPKNERLRTIYFLVGTLFTVFFNILFNIVSPMIFGTTKYQHFGDYSVIFLLVFTTYAIIKRELFEIKILLTGLLVFSIGLLLSIDTFIFTQFSTLFALKVVTLALYAYIGFVLIRTSQKEIKRTEELTVKNDELSLKNKELDTIFTITNHIVTALDPHEVAQRAADSVPEHMGFIGAIILLYQEDLKSHKILAITKSPVESTIFGLAVREGWNSKIVQKNKVLTIPFDKDNFAIFDNFYQGFPLLNDVEFTNEIGHTLGISKVINVPIYSRGLLIGAVSFLLTADQFARVSQSETEFDLMQTFAGQVGIGLENAKLFDQYLAITKVLEEKNEELKLYAEKEKDILDIMGHELRTPITIVRNSLSMLNSFAQSNQFNHDKFKHYLEIALNSAKREINIIETMLASTKVEGGKIELHKINVNPNEIIAEAMLGQKDKVKQKALQLISHVPDKLPEVYADRSRAQEIMDNLLSNAVKYTETGTVTIDSKVDDKFVYISVSDTGLGIPKELMEKLGTKFFRVSQHIRKNKDERLYSVVRPGGTGLGLYVTFNLIKLMGGAIDVKSEPNVGSVFTFSLPIYKDQKIEVETRTSKDLLAEYRKRKKGEAMSDR